MTSPSDPFLELLSLVFLGYVTLSATLLLWSGVVRIYRWIRERGGG
jgi:hypothetical protein